MRHRVRNNSVELQMAAREMRREPTQAEAVLWSALRGGKVGVRFRRQHLVGRFILDFWCAEAKLAIEVDGGIYDEQYERDEARTDFLKQFDYQVIRFPNETVLEDLPLVIVRIREAVASRGVVLPPSPAVREKGGRGG